MKMTAKGYDILRARFGKLSTQFVQGVEFLTEKCTQAGFTYSEGAYALGTTYHETGGSMQPVVERGARSYFDKYGKGNLAKQLGNLSLEDGYTYRGRGYVQITGRSNYTKFSKLFGIDLVNNPDLALDQETAGSILVLGLQHGYFTGFGYFKLNLGRYDRAGYVKMRRAVNGTDCAEQIAAHAMVFEQALRSP